ITDSARRNHYDENLVQSFVSLGVELWLLENVTTGERIFVDRAEYEQLFGDEPPTQLTPVAPPDATPSRGAVRPWFNTLVPPEQRGSSDEQDQQALFQQSQKPARPRLSATDRDDWRLLEQVISADRLLTVKGTEGIYYGLARTTLRDDRELAAYFGAQTVTRYDQSWSEGMVLFFAHPVVMGILIIVFIVGLVIELSAPGFGVFGAMSLIALLLLVGAPYLAGMAQWWDILLIVVGLLLVSAELFVIPGFGVAGIAGAVGILAGLVGLFVTSDLGSSQGQGELATGLITTLAGLFAAGIGVWLVSRQVHSLPLLNRLILSTEISDRQGRPSLLEAMGAGPREPLEAGTVGHAATDLRPAGRGDFGGKLWDVKSVGSFIAAGTPIRVVSAGRFVIEVEEADE
ncbi:MAG: NfeD family protein, partial [Planctomycetota bacterium]